MQTTAQLADKASGDHDFLQVAALYRGRPDFDVAALVNELVESESVPFLPVLRYKPSGLRKREVWERTWDLQRKQDAGEDVGDIPVPPKYTSADFLKQDYWRLRGKLDVPKERWISYPHLQTESDPSLVVGWAGWNHLQQATALVAYYDARKREGWDAKRLTPILAGLDQLLPWIHQWHPEIDPEFGDTAGQSYQSLLENDAHELGLTLEDIRRLATTSQRRKAEGERMSESARNKSPTVYVIAGPNGAGKTTFAAEFLPDFVDCRQFLNADLIAAGLSPFAPETQNVKAGRLLLERIGELATAGEDFGFETTLSGRTYARLLTGLRRDGYRVALFFLWLPSADLAVLRVANRVRQGGHAVPEADVRRRFASGSEKPVPTVPATM